MLNKITDKIKGFLRQPSGAFAREKDTDVKDALIYMALLSLVTAVLSGAAAILYPGPVLPTLSGVVGTYMFGFAAAVVVGLWLHFWAYIFGARRGTKQTLKATLYGLTPSYLLGWIPVIGIVFWLWSVYLQWVGLKTLHGMREGGATFSVAFAFIIPMILLYGLIILGGAPALGTFGPLTLPGV